jgi:hypothetical protein
MHLRDNQLLGIHQRFIDRFVDACRADTRVVAAFLGGSYAKGAADAYSDLDLCLITSDAAYESFYAGRAVFLQGLGELVFMEVFDRPNIVFGMFAEGLDVELCLGSESHMAQLHCGSYQVLLDKAGLLEGAVFPMDAPPHAEQAETLRRTIAWFWHDLAHFIAAMGRGQLWWAQSQLSELRRYCVNLPRLERNFAAEAIGYEKIDQNLPPEQLASLRATYCPLEHHAMLEAGWIKLRFYQDLAPRLAQQHGLVYPDRLERMMIDRLKHLPV